MSTKQTVKNVLLITQSQVQSHWQTLAVAASEVESPQSGSLGSTSSDSNSLLRMRPVASLLPRRHLIASTGIRDQLVQSADVGPGTANDNILISSIA